jgi:hypothetical protein
MVLQRFRVLCNHFCVICGLLFRKMKPPLWLWHAGLIPAGLLLAIGVSGCASPYRSDQGALLGGLTGAGIGALVGNALGKPLAGAMVGAGVGSMTGAVIGDNLDQIEAQNRAEIEARLGRPVSSGAVTVPDVVAMHSAGVDEANMVNHIRTNGPANLLHTADLIYLKKQGVSPRVIQALQSPPIPRAASRPPAPVIVEQHYYDDPWHPRSYRSRGYYPHRRRHPRQHHPDLSWGFSFSH